MGTVEAVWLTRPSWRRWSPDTGLLRAEIWPARARLVPLAILGAERGGVDELGSDVSADSLARVARSHALGARDRAHAGATYPLTRWLVLLALMLLALEIGLTRERRA